MDDESIIERINELSGEEHSLFTLESQGDASAADVERLRRLEVTLDQCYDLLRQRRARRDAGQDPNEAEVRDATTVEGYLA
jgi:hypothetical protein